MGLEFARRFAAEGMKVVMADVEEPALDAAVSEIAESGAEVIGVITDVSDADAMDRLGAETLDAFGAAHVVCNNAGVSGSSAPVSELTTADWAWVLGVNLWGVIHGHRVFQPILMAQDEGHIVNTASMAGHTSFNGVAPYHVTKHGVVTLSEVVYNELATAGSKVGISCLCPGFVNTKIAESDRNKPEAALKPLVTDDAGGDDVDPEVVRAMVRDFFSMQQPPDQVAGLVFDAIRTQKFYVFTDDVWTGAIAERHADIAQGRNPRPRGSMFEESIRG
jgi:NAD(P)-dependent dehydrogenase (short-subunit alcohol dehydrogenase family)